MGFGFTFVDVDRAHDNLTKVVTTNDRPLRFVCFEEEREEFRDFGIVEVTVAIEGDRITRAGERAPLCTA